MLGNLFNEFALLLFFSIFLGFIALQLYQPLILAFIATGVIVGPAGFGWIHANNEIDLLAKIGITLLLFIVGLKLDFHSIRTLGVISIATGLGQVIFTSVIGYGIGLLLGFNSITAIYLAITLTFSSTIIIVKLLSDKDEIDSLYGRIAIGYLIVQDIIVIIAIIILSSMRVNSSPNLSLGLEIVSLAAKGIGILTVVALLARYVLPTVLTLIAKSRELLVLFAIAWAVILAGSADLLGLSKEVGGFLAGVSLASTVYRDMLTSRLETLRNFLLLFFFLDLGLKLQLNTIGHQIEPAIILSLFVLIAKPFIMMIIMGAMGYRKRTSFLTGLTSAQISEFSLILAALGVTLGHLSDSVAGLITLVGIITFALSTYMIMYSHILYQWCSPLLSIFEKKILNREDTEGTKEIEQCDVIVFGIGRYGATIAKILRQSGLSVLGVDFDPQKIRHWKKNNLSVRYGDAEDIEFTKTLPLNNAKWILSTIPRHETNAILIASSKEQHFQGKVAVSIFDHKQIRAAEEINADLVLLPYKDAAAKAASRLIKSMTQ